MIVTDRLVFLQLQKTGCTHIARLLKGMFGGRERFGKHRPMPRTFDPGARLIVGSVRNPWDWYVSFWAFACEGKGGPYVRSIRGKAVRNALLDSRVSRLVSLRGRLGGFLPSLLRELDRPARQWRRLQADRDSPALFREWLKLTLDSRRRYDFFRDYGYSSISSFAGLLSYLYEVLYLRDCAALYRKSLFRNVEALRQYDCENNVLAATIRTEELEQGLIQALTRAGCDLTGEQVQKIRNAEKTNTSDRKRVLEYYYDAESIELIREREKLIVDKYEYREPGSHLETNGGTVLAVTSRGHTQ